MYVLGNAGFNPLPGDHHNAPQWQPRNPKETKENHLTTGPIVVYLSYKRNRWPVRHRSGAAPARHPRSRPFGGDLAEVIGRRFLFQNARPACKGFGGHFSFSAPPTSPRFDSSRSNRSNRATSPPVGLADTQPPLHAPIQPSEKNLKITLDIHPKVCDYVLIGRNL